jgi:hypothetical protein
MFTNSNKFKTVLRLNNFLLNKAAKYGLIVTFWLAFSAYFATNAYAQGWYNNSWGFRKSHVISASTGAGTNYQVMIVAYKAPGTDNGSDVYLGNNVKDTIIRISY